MLIDVCNFWHKHPALWVSLHALIGAAFFFHPTWTYLFFIPVLLAPFFFFAGGVHKLCQSLLLLAASYLYTAAVSPNFSTEKITQTGTAYFSPQQVKPYQNAYFNGWMIQGEIRQFISGEGRTLQRLPCSIVLDSPPPPANYTYLLHGELKLLNPYSALFKPTKEEHWRPIEPLWTLAEMRLQMKQRVRKAIDKHTPVKKTASFFRALATGDIDDYILATQLNQTGLQHILAISGFHFSLIAAFAGWFLRPFKNRSFYDIALVCLLLLYFLYIGPSASVQRAWAVLSLYFFARLFGKSASPLNLLGVALFLEILLTPTVLLNLGFHLSFLCTAAILLFYKPMKRLMLYLAPQREKEQWLKMSLGQKTGYVLVSLMRNSLALNLAVHALSIAVLLNLFHCFPLLSIYYNLFFPFCAALSLFLLISAALFASWFSALALLIHKANIFFLQFFLDLVIYPPAKLNFNIYYKLPFTWLMFILAVCLAFGIFLNRSVDENCSQG